MSDTMLFRKTCVAVYGKRWKKAASEAMGVNVLTIRRWADGESPIPEDAWFQLMKDAMSNIKQAIVAAQAKGVDFPVTVDPK